MRQLSFYRNGDGAVCFKMRQFSPDIFGEPKLITEATSKLSLNDKGELDDPKMKEHPREFMAFLKSEKGEKPEEVKEEPIKKSFFGKRK